MRQKTWNATFCIAWLTVGIAICVVAEIALHDLQMRACPIGSFISGSLGWSAVIAFLPPAAVSIAAGWLVATCVFALLPWPGAVRAAVGTIVIDVRSSIVFKVVIVAVSFLLATPLTVYKLYAGMCGWPEGLSTRDSTFAEPRYFGWKEVNRVIAGCRSGRGTYLFITLIMTDGTAISVPVSAPLPELYQKLGQALRGVPFAYDSRARTVCRSDTAARLAAPPGR